MLRRQVLGAAAQRPFSSWLQQVRHSSLASLSLAGSRQGDAGAGSSSWSARTAAAFGLSIAAAAALKWHKDAAYCKEVVEVPVLTYNVLSPELGTPSHLHSTDPKSLDKDTRLAKIKARLEHAIAAKTIIALQEVDLGWAGKFHAFFAERGYCAVFAQYGHAGTGYMGVMLAWPLSTYEAEDIDISRLSDTAPIEVWPEIQPSTTLVRPTRNEVQEAAMAMWWSLTQLSQQHQALEKVIRPLTVRADTTEPRRNVIDVIPALAELLAAAAPQIQAMAPQDVAQTLWKLGQTRRGWEASVGDDRANAVKKTVTSLAQSVLQRADEMDLHSWSRATWGLALLGETDRTLLQRLATAVVASARGHEDDAAMASDLPWIIAAFSKMEVGAAELVKATADRLTRTTHLMSTWGIAATRHSIIKLMNNNVDVGEEGIKLLRMCGGELRKRDISPDQLESMDQAIQFGPQVTGGAVPSSSSEFNEWREAKHRKNEVITARLKPRSHPDAKSFVVSTYHMPCIYGSAAKERCMNIHLYLLLQHMQRFAKGDPCVLMGDFNTKPDMSGYKLVIEGGDLQAVSAASPLPVQGLQERMPTSPPFPGGLHSAYQAFHGREPAFTNYVESGMNDFVFCATLDYIWFTPGSLKLLECPALPNGPHEVKGTFPNEEEPSDHLPLMATFQLA